MKNTNSTIRLALTACLMSLFAISGLYAQPQAVTVKFNPGSFVGEVGWEITQGTTVYNCVAPGGASDQNLTLNPGTYEVRGYDSFGDGWNGCNVDVLQGTTPVATGVTLASGGFSNSCNGAYSGGPTIGTFTIVAPTCDITCPSSVVVNNDPGQCGAFVNINDPVVDANCVGTPTNFLDVDGPVTNFNWNGNTLASTPVNLNGVVSTAGNVNMSATIVGDFDFSGLENFVLIGPDGTTTVLNANSSGQCVQTTLNTTVSSSLWNSWVSTYGANLTFTVQPNTNVGDNICSGEFVQLAASIPQSSNNFNNDYNFAGNASDFYPVGTTTVTYFTFDAGGLLVSCSFNVTVIDAEGPTFVNCPADITINLDPGACSAIVTYETAAIDNCPPAAMTVAGPYCDPCANPTGGSALACAPFAQNSIIQFVELPGAGTIDYFCYNQETFGQEPLATVYIFAPTGGAVPFINGGFTPLGQQQFQTSNANNGQCVCVDFDTPVTIPAGANGVWVEVFTPGTTLNSRIVNTPASCDGNSPTGTDSYLAAPACGFTAPVAFASIGFVLDASYALGYNPGDIETEQTDGTGYTSGDEFPIGSTTQTWVATDLAGNTSSCSFNITVLEYPNPITSLTCNDNVVIALNGTTCTEELNADLLLEGGPYGCYDNYDVEILGLGGNTLDGSNVGGTFTVRVTDPSTGNFCNTIVSVVDNIAPTLTGCTDVTVSCNADVTPGAPISGTLFLGGTDLGPVPATGTSGPADFAFDVTLPPVSITDVDVSMDVSHTWVSDLSSSLTDANGTSVTLFQTQVTCTGDNIEVTFDDEAATPYSGYQTQCAGGPAKTGTFQPQTPLSDLDGPATSGEWVLSFNDNAAGDSGALNELEIKIDYAGNFPAPTAFDACGDVTLTYKDVVTNFGDCDDITKQITRTWTAVDESGNVTTCSQTISIQKSSFAEVGVPGDYDGNDLPALLCQDQASWDADGDGMPDPAVTGAPTGTCNNIDYTYEDLVLPICEGSFKVLRTWTLIDWCVANGGGDAVLVHEQIIKVADMAAPSIQCPPAATVNANSNCQGNYILPDAQTTDNCGSTITVTIFDQNGDEYAPGDIVFGLDLGSYVFTYVATDDCGNESAGCTHVVNVVDNTPPVPVCDEQTSISLGQDGSANLCWQTIDDGSYDNCEVLAYKIKRMDSPSFVQFADCVSFSCSDVGKTIMVRMRVYDVVGNNVFTENDPDARFNECMVEATISDKMNPTIVCPAPKTIDCWEFDPALFDGVTPNPPGAPVFKLPENVQIGYYAGVFDNCGVDRVNVSQNGSPNNCGEGTVTRIYTAIDKVGRTASCVQIININNSTPFTSAGIQWPGTVNLNTCGAGLSPDELGSAPIINEGSCDLVGVSYDDTYLPVTPPGCVKLVRTWTVIDWCQPDNSYPLGYVTWSQNQQINVLESAAPSIAGCDDVTICGYQSDCQPIPAELSVVGSDDCTADEDLVYFYKIDAFYDINEPGSPTYDFDSDFNPFANGGNADNEANGSYPIGTHLIMWKVEDGCGNVTTCNYTFTVQDCKPPTPICKNLTVPVMPNSGEVALDVMSFENGDSYDNCTPYDEIVFSFSATSVQTIRTFNCDDVGPAVPVDIYATDEYGNQDKCETFVLIKDPNGVCNGATLFDVTGVIGTEDIANDPSEAVADVQVTLNNNTTNIPQVFVTDNTGMFDFSVPAQNNVQIQPAKDVDYTNGVTTFDLVQITKHVLSLDPLATPYKIIAADASNDGVVSTYDVVLLRKLILNIDQELEFNDSWRFVDASYTFPNEANPFTPPFPEVININDISQNEMMNDFVAVKIGDVTGDAKTNGLVSGDDRNFTGELVFAINDAKVDAGATHTVDFKAADFNNILGYQFTINFNNDALELVDVTAGELAGLTEANFGMTNVANGQVTTSWNAESARLADDAVVFSLTFKAKQTVELSEVISVNSAITKAEAYTANLEFFNVALRFDTENGSKMVGADFELYQNEPNPFKSTTVVGFNLPEATDATLNIYDVSGKLVMSYEGDFAKGYNNIVVERSDISATGVLYYELSTDKYTATKKMITIE